MAGSAGFAHQVVEGAPGRDRFLTLGPDEADAEVAEDADTRPLLETRRERELTSRAIRKV